jgi:hypothetical protein
MSFSQIIIGINVSISVFHRWKPRLKKKLSLRKWLRQHNIGSVRYRYRFLPCFNRVNKNHENKYIFTYTINKPRVKETVNLKEMHTRIILAFMNLALRKDSNLFICSSVNCDKIELRINKKETRVYDMIIKKS